MISMHTQRNVQRPTMNRKALCILFLSTFFFSPLTPLPTHFEHLKVGVSVADAVQIGATAVTLAAEKKIEEKLLNEITEIIKSDLITGKATRLFSLFSRQLKMKSFRTTFALLTSLEYARSEALHHFPLPVANESNTADPHQTYTLSPALLIPALSIAYLWRTLTTLPPATKLRTATYEHQAFAAQLLNKRATQGCMANGLEYVLNRRKEINLPSVSVEKKYPDMPQELADYMQLILLSADDFWGTAPSPSHLPYTLTSTGRIVDGNTVRELTEEEREFFDASIKLSNNYCFWIPAHSDGSLKNEYVPHEIVIAAPFLKEIDAAHTIISIETAGPKLYRFFQLCRYAFVALLLLDALKQPKKTSPLFSFITHDTTPTRLLRLCTAGVRAALTLFTFSALTLHTWNNPSVEEHGALAVALDKRGHNDSTDLDKTLDEQLKKKSRGLLIASTLIARGSVHLACRRIRSYAHRV